MSFLQIAAASPVLYLGNPHANAEEALRLCQATAQEGIGILLFPELNLTGLSCGDYFYRQDLLSQAWSEAQRLIDTSKAWKDLLFTIGLPWAFQAELYLLSLLVQNGEIQQAKPRLQLSEDPRLPSSPTLQRIFSSGSKILGLEDPRLGVPFSAESLLASTDAGPVKLSLLAGQDLWTAGPTHGLILHPFGRIQTAENSDHYLEALETQRLGTGAEILAAGTGKGESSTDYNYRAALYHIYSDGSLSKRETLETAEVSETLTTACIVPELAGRALKDERASAPATLTNIHLPLSDNLAERVLSPHPLFPAKNLNAYAKSVIRCQQAGLLRRLRTLRGQHCVLGFSGGLDSALALLVLWDLYKKTGRDLQDLYAYTLPGPGSGESGINLALELMEALGLKPRKISITPAVIQHLNDLEHPEDLHDVTFENAQARERTQILMDKANQVGGLVIGTGDLSEKALGWSTYNGDQMSMYELNAGIPKTLIPILIRAMYPVLPAKAKAPLEAILNRPISPELVPAKEEEPLQSSEKALGPYALHDFFIYHTEAWAAPRSCLLALAKLTFCEANLQAFQKLTNTSLEDSVANPLTPFDEKTIEESLNTFHRRFTRNQFKRSASADGAKTGPISYSPRQGLHLPSDFMGNF